MRNVKDPRDNLTRQWIHNASFFWWF
jgi:hypothetical protein